MVMVDNWGQPFYGVSRGLLFFLTPTLKKILPSASTLPIVEGGLGRGKIFLGRGYEAGDPYPHKRVGWPWPPTPIPIVRYYRKYIYVYHKY